MRSHSIIATPPGATITELLVDKGLNENAFAICMQMSAKYIHDLLAGVALLTSDVAARLEIVLGLPARFWMNLESVYREKIIKIHDENM